MWYQFKFLAKKNRHYSEKASRQYPQIDSLQKQSRANIKLMTMIKNIIFEN